MDILVLATLLPFLAAALYILLPRGAAALHRGLALAATGAGLAAAVVLCVQFHASPDPRPFDIHFPWLPTLGLELSFGLDGVSLPLFALAALGGFVAVLVSGGVKNRTAEYYAMLLLTAGSAMAAFSSTNLFFFYFFAEVATLPKFVLTAGWGALPAGWRDTPGKAAMQLTLYIAGAAIPLLLGLILLYGAAGTLDLPALAGGAARHLTPATQTLVYGLILLGAGVWASLWPFHAWSPLAYSAAPTAGSMLFAGVLKNFGAYLLVRLGAGVLPAGAAAWSGTLAILATIGVLYAGWAAIRQRDWNAMIAYGSISHAGYLLLAVAAGSPLALTAAVVFMVAHGVGTMLLFALSGSLYEQTGDRRIHVFGGLARAMPFAGVAMGMAVLAGSGLPGFGNFAGEIMIFAALWKQQTFLFQAATVASVWTVVTTAVYFLRALRQTFHGPARPEFARFRDPGMAVRAAAILLILVSLAIGLMPGRIAAPAARVLGSAAVVAGGGR